MLLLRNNDGVGKERDGWDLMVGMVWYGYGEAMYEGVA
jgi:hypothetical protein